MLEWKQTIHTLWMAQFAPACPISFLRPKNKYFALGDAHMIEPCWHRWPDVSSSIQIRTLRAHMVKWKPIPMPFEDLKKEKTSAALWSEWHFVSCYAASLHSNHLQWLPDSVKHKRHLILGMALALSNVLKVSIPRTLNYLILQLQAGF